MPISPPSASLEDLEHSLRHARKRLRQALDLISDLTARTARHDLSDDRRQGIVRAGSAIQSQVRTLTRALTKTLSLDRVEGGLKRSRRQLRRVLRRMAPPGARTAFDALNADQRVAMVEAGASIHGLIADLRSEVDAALHPAAARIAATTRPAVTSKRAGRNARTIAGPVAVVPSPHST